MQFEFDITFHDLFVILSNISGKEDSINVTFENKEESNDWYYPRHFDIETGLLSLEVIDAPGKMITTHFTSIECIEFEFFYKYKGGAAKIFKVS